MILKKNQDQLPLLCSCAGRELLRPLPRPLSEARPPPLLRPSEYRFSALTEMISWLSLSSPVSAERPRYATEGMAKLESSAERLKHSVHESSVLYCSSRDRDLSWK